MKYRSELKHGFTNRDYWHCAILKALHKSRGMQYILQNVQNEIFKIFKIFKLLKNNMKFIRAAC